MAHRWLALAFVGALVFVSQTAWAQAPGGFGGRGGFGGGGFGGGGGGLLASINDSNVQKELELLDDQVTKLQDVQRKIGESMRDSFSGLGDLQNLSDEERRAKFDEIRTKADTKRKEIEKEAEAILLPSQVERLKQINVQNQLRFRSTADVLGSQELKDALGLTDDQIEKLKAAQEEAQKELQAKIAKITEETREKVLAVLSPEQREKIKKLIGAKIEFSPQQQFGRGGAGGFGGAGGTPGGAGQGGRGGRGGRPGN